MLRALILTGIAMLMTATASGDVAHAVRFQSEPTVMVWGDAGRGGTGVKPGQVPVMTGLLVSAVEPKDRAEFHVASNSGFKVVADTTDLFRYSEAQLAESMLSIQISGVGTNADATNFSHGHVWTGTLAQLQADPTVFRTAYRTAAHSGQPQSQSVSFLAEWSNSSMPVGLAFNVVSADS